MEIILHMPQDAEACQKLFQKVAEVHANGIKAYIDKLPYPKEQKQQIILQLINELK